MIPDRTYTADSICPTPDIDVPDSLKPFVKDTDYKVYCYDNVNAGEATLVVEGIGNYADTIKTIFIINPQSSRFPPHSKTWCITAGALKVAFAQNELMLTTAAASELKIFIFDMQGYLKKEYRGYSNGSHNLSLNQMNRGSYITRVIPGNCVQTLRINVQ